MSTQLLDFKHIRSKPNNTNNGSQNKWASAKVMGRNYVVGVTTIFLKQSSTFSQKEDNSYYVMLGDIPMSPCPVAIGFTDITNGHFIHAGPLLERDHSFYNNNNINNNAWRHPTTHVPELQQNILHGFGKEWEICMCYKIQMFYVFICPWEVDYDNNKYINAPTFTYNKVI